MFVAGVSLISRAMADVDIAGEIFKGWEVAGGTSLAGAIRSRCEAGKMQALTFLRRADVKRALQAHMGGQCARLISAAELWYQGATSGDIELVEMAFQLGFGSVFLEEAEKLTTSQAVKDFIRARLPKRDDPFLARLKTSAQKITEGVQRLRRRRRRLSAPGPDAS